MRPYHYNPVALSIAFSFAAALVACFLLYLGAGCRRSNTLPRHPKGLIAHREQIEALNAMIEQSGGAPSAGKQKKSPGGG